jgi:hypothetical protein
MSWYAINMDISLRFPKWTSITGDFIDCQNERKHDIRQGILHITFLLLMKDVRIKDLSNVNHVTSVIVKSGHFLQL